MSSIFEDDSVFDCFEAAHSHDPRVADDLKVEVLDWFDGSGQPCSRIASVADLSSRPPSALRIIFAPLDLTGTPYTDGLIWLFRHYSVPSAFLGERLQSVTHSFGSLVNDNGYNCAWFHFLCKSVSVKHANDEAWISDPRPGLSQMDHADGTWIRSGFFLQWKRSGKNPPQITLLCFEASSVLKSRLYKLPFATVNESAARDPLSLFVIILDDLSRQLNLTVWDVSSVFGEVETKTLKLSESRESFTGLHNLAKHVIYLQESSDAVLLTVKKLSMRHLSLIEEAPSENRQAMKNTAGMLTQIETQLETANLRLRSLEKRMKNVISLSFHLVTQEGNRIMLSDSNAMATIAFVTLVFLPATTISTIFGSQFFNQSSDGSSITVLRDFWIFWVIAIPVTVVVIYIWTEKAT
ncbi:hypothetical protein BDV29DRAFT_196188 [Aspergillus leporis]|uniref:Uncharacterized protein n=1 Tax=Aspergillus leporis TaxID=41062 RepID=A0A5N5WH73_9EURO|nr:hypothetical protein BDV29DRAFT_196188 [Aspergillus leporis]